MSRFPRRPSLARRIAVSFFLFYALALLFAVQALAFIALFEDDAHFSADVAMHMVFADLERTGRLALPADAEITSLAERNDGLWFVARQDGKQLTFGPVPDGVTRLLDTAPGTLKMLEMRLPADGGPVADASLERREAAGGELTVIAGGADPSTIGRLGFNLYLYRLGAVWFIVGVVALAIPAIAIIVPLVLRGVRPLAEEAGHIDPADLGHRLPERGVVKELLPLVHAFNAALDRVAEAFDRRRRFIADVAHELRTPLAVLNMHVEALPAGAPKPDLQRGVFRLGQMVGQMLDAERLALTARRREPVDLVALTRVAVADIAPLAVTNGYEIAVAAESDAVFVDADPYAVARAISNLLGNAIAHGGNQGLIEARVTRDGAMEVCDEGPGVPAEALERIFEPFRRERWDRDGCGLGLHLVREIMSAHGGTATLVSSPQGTIFRLTFAELR